jgi:hypothetical protein
MTRRPRVTSLEQADAEVESLRWLRGAGSPNGAVRRLFECYAVVRAELHRQQQGEQKRPSFAEREEMKRKG